MINVKVEIEEARKELEDLGIESPKIQRKVLTALGTGTKKAIKKSYSRFLHVGETGKLLKSIIRKVARDGNSVSIYPTAKNENVNYGFVLASGADILPINGNVLSFKAKDGSILHITEAKIPARDWVEGPANEYINSSEPDSLIEQVVQKEVNRVMKEEQ